MDRAQAVEIARKHAKAKPRSYYAEPFEPHEWVVDAILEAALGNRAEVPIERNKRAYCEACGYTDSHDPNCPMPQPICVEVVCTTPGDCRRAGICQWEEGASSGHSLVGDEFDRATQNREQKEAANVDVRTGLRGCPFCGGRATHVIGSAKPPAHYVMCTNGDCNATTAMRAFAADAAQDWNRRP